MVTVPLLLILMAVVLFNSFIGFHHSELIPIILGFELVVFGIFIIYKSEWTAKFVYQNLLNYPFFHNFIPKNSGIKESVLKTVGILSISLGFFLIVGFFIGFFRT